MKLTTEVRVGILAALCLFVGWMGARFTAGDRLELEEVQNLLRAAGDSAVTEFRDGDGMREFVAEQLGDTVEHYEAEVRAAAVVQIERDTVTFTDTLTVIDTVELRMDGDTATVALVPVRQDGFTLRDTLRLVPRPTFLVRTGAVVFDPDSVVVALLRTPEGVQRFTAAARGMAVAVVDAAELRVGRPTTIRKVLEVGTAAACLVSGFLAGDGRAGLALAVGAGCAGGVGIGFLMR